MTAKKFAVLARHFAKLHLRALKAKQERSTEKFWGNHQCSKSCHLKKSVGYQSVCGVLICDEGAEPPPWSAAFNDWCLVLPPEMEIV